MATGPRVGTPQSQENCSPPLAKAEETAPQVSTFLKLSAAIEYACALYSSQHLGERQTFGRLLLELIFEVVPATRGAVLLVRDEEEDLAPVAAWDRVSGSLEAPPAGCRMLRELSRGGEAILSDDGSRMCLPLATSGRRLGAIELESAAGARFEEQHLQLMVAMARMMAAALENHRQREWLERENHRLRAPIELEHDMVGQSPRMRQVYRFIEKVASTDSTVLIQGESGTGKELVACALHRNSPRADRPFVAINCAALAEPLLESELFGHEKGSFTGAIAQKRGMLEVAAGGTVFLDEVTELTPALQAKLLRALQQMEFTRVGGTRPIKVDIRLIAATNKNLDAVLQSGKLREDFYFRLNVVSLTMPPLRERCEDIPLLAGHFAEKYSRKRNLPLHRLSPEARACLSNYDWPGNVRELENAIERAIVLGSSEVIQPEDLPEAVLECPPADRPSRYQDALSGTKKELILKALEQTKGNCTEAARTLGVHPNYLHRLISKLGLRETLKKRD